MPYCSHCGKAVREQDFYCAACGARQPVSHPPVAGDSLTRMPAHRAALLCYIPYVGWIAAIAVLAAERFRTERFVRFHAFQGLYLFVAWLLVNQVVRPFLRVVHRGFPLGSLLELTVIGAMIFMLVKVSQNQNYSLPIVGDLAEKSASEM
jgi:uncharacterized membrane protein